MIGIARERRDMRRLLNETAERVYEDEDVRDGQRKEGLSNLSAGWVSQVGFFVHRVQQ